jgi:hypothetical protein
MLHHGGLQQRVARISNAGAPAIQSHCRAILSDAPSHTCIHPYKHLPAPRSGDGGAASMPGDLVTGRREVAGVVTASLVGTEGAFVAAVAELRLSATSSASPPLAFAGLPSARLITTALLGRMVRAVCTVYTNSAPNPAHHACCGCSVMRHITQHNKPASRVH